MSISTTVPKRNLVSIGKGFLSGVEGKGWWFWIWNVSWESFQHPGAFPLTLSSTALPSEIQMPTGKLFWNKVQSSYPAAITGLSDVMQTECSQYEEKSNSCSLGPYPGHVDYSRETLLVMVVNSVLKCGLYIWSSVQWGAFTLCVEIYLWFLYKKIRIDFTDMWHNYGRLILAGLAF